MASAQLVLRDPDASETLLEDALALLPAVPSGRGLLGILDAWAARADRPVEPFIALLAASESQFARDDATIFLPWRETLGPLMTRVARAERAREAGAAGVGLPGPARGGTYAPAFVKALRQFADRAFASRLEAFRDPLEDVGMAALVSGRRVQQMVWRCLQAWGNDPSDRWRHSRKSPRARLVAALVLLLADLWRDDQLAFLTTADLEDLLMHPAAELRAAAAVRAGAVGRAYEHTLPGVVPRP